MKEDGSCIHCFICLDILVFNTTFFLSSTFFLPFLLLPPLHVDLRYTLVVLVMFLLSSALCPVLWYLWIHTGSANANFFFAMTLTYALAQVLHLVQFLSPSHKPL